MADRQGRSLVLIGTLIGLLIVSLYGGRVAYGCPACAESLPSGKSGDDSAMAGGSGAGRETQAGLADGFYYSILLMLFVPAATACGLGGMLYVSLKRRNPALAGLNDPVTAESTVSASG